MSVSALLFLGAFFVLVGMALVRDPIWGLYAYFLTFYESPTNYWWGEALPDLRWSLLAAAVTLVAIFIHNGRAAEKPRPIELTARDDRARLWYSTVPAILLITLCGYMWLETMWAINFDSHFEGVILYTKYVLLFAMLYQICSTPERLEAAFWCQIVGCLLWGFTAWQTETNGRLEIPLSPEGADGNLLGYHFSMGMICAGFAVISFKRWKSLAALLAIPLMLNAVILTASRSAMMGLLAGGVGALIFAPKSRRKQLYFACVLAIPLFLRLADSDLFWDRMDTMRIDQNEPMEASAASRLPIIKANWRMFLDHPAGVGYRNNMFLSPQYMDDTLLTVTDTGSRVRAAHNIVMAYLVDFGVVGFLFFAGTLAWAFSTLFRLARLDRRGLSPVLGGFRGAIGAALLAHLISGQFINLQKTESWFWMIALLAVLARLAPESLASQAPAVARDEPLMKARPHGWPQLARR